MEDIRTYRVDEKKKDHDEERQRELEAARNEEEVPFHIPRD